MVLSFQYHTSRDLSIGKVMRFSILLQVKLQRLRANCHPLSRDPTLSERGCEKKLDIRMQISVQSSLWIFSFKGGEWN